MEGGRLQPSKYARRVGDETQSYFLELGGRLREAEDEEERAAIAAGALEEVRGHELQVATDLECSRVLEAMLPLAQPTELHSFLSALTQDDERVYTLVTNPYGSHVTEALLKTLAKSPDLAPEVGAFVGLEDLGKFCRALAANLADVATNRYGSHVARKLVSFLAGQGGEKDASAKSYGPAGRKHGGIESRVGGNVGPGGGSGAVPAPLFPDLLALIAQAVLDFPQDWVRDLVRHEYASPFFQVLLHSLRKHPSLRQTVAALLGVPPEGRQGEEVSLTGLDSRDVARMCVSKSGSHLVEAIVQTCPADLAGQLARVDCFAEGLLKLARHPCGNFVVQAMFGAVDSGAMLRGLLNQLLPEFQTLLETRRAGVVTSALAAAQRVQSMESEAVEALFKALAAFREVEGDAPASDLDLLLRLDTYTGGQPPRGGEAKGAFSLLGCVIASTALKMSPSGPAGRLSESLLQNSEEKLSSLAFDRSGVHVLEAFLQGPHRAHDKGRLVSKLSASFVDLACEASGSYLMEKCFDACTGRVKEDIVRALAGDFKRVSRSRRGPTLVRRCHLEAYLTSPEVWQKQVAREQKTHSIVEEILAPASGRGKKRERQERKRAREAEAAAANGTELTPEPKEKKKKKTKDKDKDKGKGR